MAIDLQEAIRQRARQAWEMTATDLVTLIDAGTEIQLKCAMRDVEPDSSGGVKVNTGGVKQIRWRKLAFNRDYLAEQGVTITPAVHWLIDGERWDFVPKKAISDKLGPIGGSHTRLECYIQEATTINRGRPGTHVTVDP